MAQLSPRVVQQYFSDLGVDISDVQIREFPEETNILAYVGADSYNKAIEMAEEVEDRLKSTSSHEILLVVRRIRVAESNQKPMAGVHDPRAVEFRRIIAARNRVSDVQPSLSYVRDPTGSLSTVSAQRHHLVFGRRGVGKSTLLVEARQTVQNDGALTTWVNLQTLRREPAPRIFLRIAREMIISLLVEMQRKIPTSSVVADTNDLLDRLAKLIRSDNLREDDAQRVIPDVQYVLRRGLGALGSDMFVFVDDFYYIPREQQPEILDILHGCVRDCRAWLKIASIKNLTRWFRATPPTGLQTGQDADLIDLDVTLQEPDKLRRYLEDILTRYCTEVGIQRPSGLFRNQAIDRLLLASGGVPRDFLVLASASVGRARERENAKVVGVQEVNKAAGDAADVKIQELEDDVAANRGLASRTLDALKLVRDFCLNEVAATYFAIDFLEKEEMSRQYQVFGDLLDLRLLHLVHGSVSAAHEVGKKTEIFMLDLSQYTGSRLKQGLKVIDLEKDTIVARRTRTAEKPRRATDARSVIALFRLAPRFSLSRLSELSADSVEADA